MLTASHSSLRIIPLAAKSGVMFVLFLLKDPRVLLLENMNIMPRVSAPHWPHHLSWAVPY